MEDKPLEVYLVGNQMHSNNEETEKVFQTLYMLGEFTPTASQRGQGGYIFNQAMNSFKREVDREIVITRFDNTATMLETVYDEWKNGGGPDVLIGDYTEGRYCLYPYMEEGMFADLLSYFEQDEIYSSGEYVSNVMKAGMVNDKQLVFPLTFNMNVLYTSEERQNNHEKWFSKGITYSELIQMFCEGWNEYGKSKDYLMLQFTNMWPTDYPCVLFQAASGERIVDYNTGKIILNEATFEEWAVIYESFICDDYDMSKEELKEMVKLNNGVMRYDISSIGKFMLEANDENQLDVFDILCLDALCIAEGGNRSYTLHSLRQMHPIMSQDSRITTNILYVSVFHLKIVRKATRHRLPHSEQCCLTVS